jgi:hypothetical protein
MKLLILILVLISFQTKGQFTRPHHSDGILGFFKMKEIPISRWKRTTPVFVTFTGSDTQSTFGYWMGSSITRYSANGRFTSTNVFDVNGQLRETRSSIRLQKKGILSSWKVQFSPQRSRPLFIYTIPD